MSHGKTDAARATLIKYHGNGNLDSAVVRLDLHDMQISIDCDAEMNKSQKWWDYRMLFNNKEKLYRMWLASPVTIFSQFIGGSVVSLLLEEMMPW